MAGTLSDFKYIGSELERFTAAWRWKGYLHRQIAPYLGPTVLEVGAGIGGTTKAFCRDSHHRWVCLEPDRILIEQLTQAIAARELPSCCQPVIGTLNDVRDLQPFDTLLYIDVLEHIENDRGELAQASCCLKPGGHLVVLSPAHPFLYTPFDRAIGHYRRYTRESLLAVSPPGMEITRVRYLDSAGMLASLANRLVLKQSMPAPSQIAFWDKFLVRFSTVLDPLLGFRVGKSILGIWRKPPSSQI
jgi:SAM-dependent methyltransferase